MPNDKTQTTKGFLAILTIIFLLGFMMGKI